MKNKELSQKKVAFLTGSSRGIGFAIAKKLANSDFDIVLNGKNTSCHLKDAAEEIRKTTKAKVLCLAFDISDTSHHNKALLKIISEFGRIDCLVNNAGISVRRRQDLMDIDYDSFDEQISVNLRSHFFLTQTIARWMIQNPSKEFRSIINISSSNAEAVSLNRGEYCISKSGLTMMTKLFATRLANDRINVYEVMPGLIQTDMTASAKEYYDKLLEKGFSPINRWGKPEDVANVVQDLASSRWAFVTGESIHVDGGLLIPRY